MFLDHPPPSLGEGFNFLASPKGRFFCVKNMINTELEIPYEESEKADLGYFFARYNLSDGHLPFESDGSRVIFLREIGSDEGEFLVFDPEKVVADHFRCRTLEEKLAASARYRDNYWRIADTGTRLDFVAFMEKEKYRRLLAEYSEKE